MKPFIFNSLRSKSYNIPRLLYIALNDECRHTLSSSITKNTWEEFSNSLLKTIEKKQTKSIYPILNHEFYNSRRKRKKYILSMFPYPSGKLHMGHVRVYTMADAVARYYYMKGYEVLHPMGWDAFGLPAENAAIEIGKNPDDWTSSNISNMKKQLNELGCCFDWSRELATCDPKYYKWTQLLFLKLYKAGLAYRKEAVVNWDPVDKTVLANEQVNAKGISWRSGAKVEKKHLKQWFIKTTRYAKDLYEDLNHLPQESWGMVSGIQKHWIGECNGYAIELKLVDTENNEIEDNDKLPVWMANPEELVNVNFLSVPSGHILDQEKYLSSVQEHIKILSVFATEPISQKRLPIIVCDDVDYVQDCQVYAGIPRLNKKDKHLCSICGFSETNHNLVDLLNVDSMSNVRETLLKRLSELGCGGYETSARLRDWLISRQRYWGTPIPIIYCGKCGTIPVPETDLPVTLPEVKGFINKGAAVLKEIKEWYNCQCPSCGGPATREIDTMDTFVDSSWYFLRYLDVNNDTNLVSKEKADYYMPVDLYIGGKEHAELHLYYARFIQKFLRDQGLVSSFEPFHKLLSLAVVKNKSYRVKETGKYLSIDKVDFSVKPPVEKGTNASLIIKYEKMSKSKHNGVDPKIVLNEFGVDATRFSILTNNEPGLDIKWSNGDISESTKFIEKLYFYVKSLVLSRLEGLPSTPLISFEETIEKEKTLYRIRNNYILNITHRYENSQFLHLKFDLHRMLNEIVSVGQIMLLNDEYEKSLRALLLMLTPICPHISAEFWERLNAITNLKDIDITKSVFEQSWPHVEPNFPIKIDCQVDYIKMSDFSMPFSQFLSLDRDIIISLAKRTVKIENQSDLFDIQFNPSEIEPSVNFLTKSKDKILRELDCEVKKKIVCTIKLPQDDYVKLTDNRAFDLARNNEVIQNLLKTFYIKSTKLYFEPDGRSRFKIHFIQRNTN